MESRGDDDLPEGGVYCEGGHGCPYQISWHSTESRDKHSLEATNVTPPWWHLKSRWVESKMHATYLISFWAAGNQIKPFLEPDVTVFEWQGWAGEDVLMDLATLQSQGSDDLMLHGWPQFTKWTSFSVRESSKLVIETIKSLGNCLLM